MTFDGEVYRVPSTESVMGNELLLDVVGGPDIPATSCSEGTLIVVGLLTVLMNRRRPKLVLIDDLDRGLHPAAQAALVDQLRRVQELFDDLQVFATSHSPYVIDAFEPKEVFLMNLGDDGAAACRRIDEHPDFARWRDDMTLGEFWTFAGESWVSGE